MPELWLIIILGYIAFVTSFGARVVAVNLPAHHSLRFRDYVLQGDEIPPGD